MHSTPTLATRFTRNARVLRTDIPQRRQRFNIVAGW